MCMYDSFHGVVFGVSRGFTLSQQSAFIDDGVAEIKKLVSDLDINDTSEEDKGVEQPQTKGFPGCLNFVLYMRDTLAPYRVVDLTCVLVCNVV